MAATALRARIAALRSMSLLALCGRDFPERAGAEDGLRPKV
jgi:hypothetical protein